MKQDKKISARATPYYTACDSCCI